MIESIKSNIKNNLNCEVKIISKENRSRDGVYYGNIVEVYDRVFIVSNGIDKRSYSYSDVLSKEISISYL